MIKTKGRFFLIIFILLFSLSVISAGSVTREISQSDVDKGETLTVKLIVGVGGSESFYLIDELIPAGWSIVDKGTADNSQQNHLKWATIYNANDITYTYKIKTNNLGDYLFNGTYVFEGDDSENIITGDNSISVAESSSGNNNDGSSNSEDASVNSSNSEDSGDSYYNSEGVLVLKSSSDNDSGFSLLTASLIGLLILVVILIILFFLFKR